jgi:hypothetical protein
VVRPGAQVSAAELLEHSRSRIARYKCPSAVEFMNALPSLLDLIADVRSSAEASTEVGARASDAFARHKCARVERTRHTGTLTSR